MKYENVVKGCFIDRPNRFIAHVNVNGKVETVHVKNTGRCKELLIEGVEVILDEGTNPNRKTRYDLIGVYKEHMGLINIDSQAPNKVVKEWLASQDYDYVKPEYVYGDSRIDFYMERCGERYLMEVKGCTLERNNIGYFPDAPTERGVKHIYELIKAVNEGYHSILAFVIQMDGVYEVLPNMEIHPEFGNALKNAQAAGVEIIYLPCRVWENEICIADNK